MSKIKNHIDGYAHENNMTFQEAMADPNCLTVQVDKPAVTLRFWHEGDRTVGITGDSCTLTLPISLFDEADATVYIEAVTGAISDALAEVWEFRVRSEQVL